MKSTQLTPMPGKVIVIKLPDDNQTKSGIILPKEVPLNKKHEYVEVIAVGSQISEDMNKKITVNVGDKCLVLGKGIYDSVETDEGLCYIVNPVDIVATLEED